MNDTIQVDLKEIGGVLLKYLWAIILCAVIGGLLLLTYTVSFVKPTYKAGVTMYVNNSSAVNGNSISSSDLAVARGLVETYINIIASNTVLEQVVQASGQDITVGQLKSMLSAAAVGETEMFTVSVTAEDPQQAADLANTIAEIAPDAIKEFFIGSRVKVVDYAKVPQSRYGPSYTKNTILGFVIGALLAAIFVVVRQMMDTRIVKKEDLERICGVPVLGLIPESDDMLQLASNRKGRQ